MAAPNVLKPHPQEFDRFLHASVGEDRNGYAVTVLSMLARLGLDPWKETDELVMLGQDAAQARLGALFAQFLDVPSLESDHSSVARELSQLLPAGRASGSLKRAATTVTGDRPGTSGAFWAVLAIIALLFQLIIISGVGVGE